MKNTVLIALVIVLVLALGVESGYLLKSHMDRKSETENTQDIYRPTVTKNRSSAPAVHSALPHASFVGTWQTNPFFDESSDGWDPFREMEDMQRVMNRMFQSSFSRGLQSGALSGETFSYSPDIDVKDAGKEYVIRVDLPGIDKDKVNVKVEQNHIVISGERTTEKDESNGQSGVYRSERSFGSFHRVIPLPADADSEHMSAQSANGVLTVHIAKLENAKRTEKSVPIQ